MTGPVELDPNGDMYERVDTRYEHVLGTEGAMRGTRVWLFDGIRVGGRGREVQGATVAWPGGATVRPVATEVVADGVPVNQAVVVAGVLGAVVVLVLCSLAFLVYRDRERAKRGLSVVRVG